MHLAKNLPDGKITLMKIALNGATTMHAGLSTDIRAAAAAGYDLVEIWSAKLYSYLETKSTADLAAEFEHAGIRPYSINSIEHITFRSDADYADIKAECEKLARIASEIGCPYIVVVPGKLPANAGKEQIVTESVRVLTELSDIAAQFDISLAFEFLGQADCSVQTLDLCSEIVNEAGRENIGCVIDSFHFYAGGSTFEAIDNIDPAKIFIFHINDAEDLPKDQLTDAQRLYPGMGILPLVKMKEHFDRIGYDKMVSIEIFRPEYWEQDPFEVARKAKAATEETLGLGRYAAGGTW